MQYCASHTESLIRDKFGFAIILEALLHAEGDKLSVINEIISLVKENPKNEDHVMSHPVASRVVKTLVANDFVTKDGNGMYRFF